MCVRSTQPIDRICAVNSTQSLGKKLEDQQQTVVIFTEPRNEDHLELAQSILTRCTQAKLAIEHVNTPGSELLGKITALRQDGKIGDGTQIVILMHGGIDSTTKQHVLDGSVSTYDIVNSVRNEPIN